MNQPLIILGMHRSGTSLLTNILRQIGIHIGADIDNNYESKFFVNLNDWAFFQAGATWDSPQNMSFITNDFISNIAKTFEKKLNSFSFTRHYKGYKNLKHNDGFWAWKDPRNTFTFPIWQEIFPEAKFIHIYRNPVDVAESLRQRELTFQKLKFSKTKTGLKKCWNEYFLRHERIYAQSVRVSNFEQGIKLWEEYTSIPFKINRNILHFSYESFIENPKKNILQICDFIVFNRNLNFDLLTQKTINSNRKFAFLNNPDLINLYKSMEKSSLMKILNYDKLI